MKIIVIIVLSSLAEAVIQLKVMKLEWSQLRHQFYKGHIAWIRTITTPMRNLPLIHFGGDKVLFIMKFKY